MPENATNDTSFGEDEQKDETKLKQIVFFNIKSKERKIDMCFVYCSCTIIYLNRHDEDVDHH